MRLRQIYEDGRIVKGVNTTVDVGPDEIKKQAAKFGNSVDKDGRPPTLSKKVKGAKTNVLFNLGLAESKQFAEALGEIANTTHIYVDMDGVLADFFTEWGKLMGKDNWRDIGIEQIPAALEKIRQTENFWLDLPLTKNAKNLLNLIKDVKGEYSICSSPLPGDPNSEPHKLEWIKKHLNFFPPKEVIITHDKPKYATQKDGTPNILIDDYGKNINAWEAAGGVGFKHKDHKFERTAKDIKQHMQEPVEENFADRAKAAADKANSENKLLDKPTPSIKQLSKKHNVDKDDIISQVKKGVKVELEHTSDPKIALEIALDHINELPDYYDRLETVEENISVTGTERGQEARKKKLRPGSEAWFKHWFSLPLMKRESFEEAKRELQQHLTGLIEDTIIVEEIVTEETLDVAGIITPSIKKLDTVFNKNKYEIRIVGGAVRDIALGKSPKDIDMATDATPDEMIAMLDREGIKHIPTGIEHGTITAVVDGEDFEITTLRADSNTDGRRAEVEFVRSWEEDAKRRDLTYNAMSMDIDGQIYDYHNGMDDLQDKVSKFVGDPAERIQEDYLRILRYFRFQGRMENPTWDKDTVSAIADNASGLSKISAERVWMEMQKILGGKNVASILQYIKSTGVADVIGLTVDNLSNIQDDADPIIQLAKLGNPAEIARRWKMTNINAGMLEFLVTHKDQKLDKKQIEDMIADGVDKEKISALATLQGNTNMASHATSVSVPEFPVTGKDLIAKGMKPGLELGQKLAQLKTKWKQSNFKATKDDLLNEDLGTPVDWEFIVAVALAAKMTPFAVKAMWKTAKGAYKIKKFADKMGIKMSKAVMGEDISRNDMLAKFKTNQRERYMDAMLGAMHKLVQSKGKRHDISNYAFEIAKSFNFNPRQLEKLYREKYGVTENFADGKVKGKSRPGRVKRSGASCNGSVTELRAKAKKASGEKAKMYHWCANMKSGKQK